MTKKNVLVFGDKVVNAMKRMDGWVNTKTGLGTDRDKAMFSSFSSSSLLADSELDDLYHEEDGASLICDKVPEDALRQGFKVKVIPEGSSDLIAAEDAAAEIETRMMGFLEDMDTKQETVNAWVWANVYGLGAIMPGLKDGQYSPTTPLQEDQIKSFTHLNVIEKPYIIPHTWYSDPDNKKYGRPQTYLLTTTPVTSVQQAALSPEVREVHESRLIVFDGKRTSVRKKKEHGGVDYSMLQRVHQVLKQFGVSYDILGHMIQDAFQGIFKMEGLMEALAQNEIGMIERRLQLLDLSRSAVRALILDAEGEEFNRQNFSFVGIDGLYELFMMRLSMATRIPVTILMGRSPAGENATGDADFQAWYDHVASERDNRYDKNLKRIVKLAFLSKDGPTGGVEPPQWEIEYPPLWQPRPKEKAEIFEIYSRSYSNLATARIIAPEEIALSAFTPQGFNPQISIDREARKQILKTYGLRSIEPQEEPEPGDNNGDTKNTSEDS